MSINLAINDSAEAHKTLIFEDSQENNTLGNRGFKFFSDLKNGKPHAVVDYTDSSLKCENRGFSEANI